MKVRTVLLAGLLICPGVWASPPDAPAKKQVIPKVDVKPNIKPGVQPQRPPQVLRTACPDPAATLRIGWPRRNADGTYTFHLLAVVTNRGSVPFRSNRNQTQITISEGSRVLKSETWPSAALNTIELAPGAGTASNFVVERYNLSSEFLADFTARISYDPDIRIDSNPENDDCNAANNLARLTVAEVRRTLQSLP